MANNFDVLDEKLDSIKEQISNIKDSIEHLNTKMFIGNGQRSFMSRLDQTENDISLLKNYKNQILRHIWGVFAFVGTTAVFVLGWLIDKGIIKWMAEN